MITIETAKERLQAALPEGWTSDIQLAPMNIRAILQARHPEYGETEARIAYPIMAGELNEALGLFKDHLSRKAELGIVTDTPAQP